MIMESRYLFDLKEHIRDTSSSVFVVKNLTAAKILGDPDLMDRLWTTYQKSVEEYDVDEDYAYRDALYEVLGIPPTVQ